MCESRFLSQYQSLVMTLKLLWCLDANDDDDYYFYYYYYYYTHPCEALCSLPLTFKRQIDETSNII